MNKIIENLKSTNKKGKDKDFSKYEISMERKSRTLTKEARNKENPFENMKQERKFGALGQKNQEIHLSKSRSNQLNVRRETLLKEFHDKPKENTFEDFRQFREKVFEEKRKKQLQRIGSKLKSKNKFNLEDESDIRNEQTLGDKEEKEPESKKRKNNVFNEIIQKSKKFKGQKRKERVEYFDTKDELDQDFNEISSLLKLSTKQVKEHDEYDLITKELLDCDKVQPEKKKKSLKESLKIEKDGRGDENFEIDENYLKQEEEEYQDDEFEKNLLTVDEDDISDEEEKFKTKSTGNDSQLSVEDQDEKEEDIEGDEKEEDIEGDEQEISQIDDQEDEEEEKNEEEEQNESKVSNDQENRFQDEEEQNESQVKEEQDENDTSKLTENSQLTDISNIEEIEQEDQEEVEEDNDVSELKTDNEASFISQEPEINEEYLNESSQLNTSISDDEPEPKEEKKLVSKVKNSDEIISKLSSQKDFEKLIENKVSNISKYFDKQVNEKQFKFLLNFLFKVTSVQELEELTKIIKDSFYSIERDATEILRKKLYSIHSVIKYPNISEIYFFKLLLSIYKTDDFRHSIITPLTVFLHQILVEKKVESLEDIVSGLYICSMIHHTLKQEKLSPETIMWFDCLIDSKWFKDLKDEIPKNKLSFDTKEKHEIFYYLLQILKIYLNIECTSYKELYENIKLKLKNVKIFQSLIQEMLGVMNRNESLKREPLQWLYQKPVELKTFEPLIYGEFKGRMVDSNQDRLKKRILEKKVKREKKASMRELRKDNFVLRKAREEEQKKIDQQKKDKYKQAIKFIEQEKSMHSQLDFSENKRAEDLKKMRKARKKK